jgi:hypothetical protein
VQCVLPEHGMVAICNLAGPRGHLSRVQCLVLGTDMPDEPVVQPRIVKDGAGPRNRYRVTSTANGRAVYGKEHQDLDFKIAR